MLRKASTKENKSESGDLSLAKAWLSDASSTRAPLAAKTRLLPIASTGRHARKSHPQELPSPAPTKQSPALEVFTAYAQSDVRFFFKIQDHLEILKIQDWPIFCEESEIYPGTGWQKNDYLNTANLILLLISPTFLRSTFCYCEQMHIAVERDRTDKLCSVIPIILHPLHPHVLDRTPFGHLDFLPANRKAISTWAHPHKAYAEITGNLIKQIEFMAYYL